MNCKACAGACCESFAIPIADLKPPNADAMNWIQLHGSTRDGYLQLECRCTALQSDGLCGIYEERPLVCRMFVPGSADCLATVKKRRTPDDYQAIRDAEDPVSL